MEKYIIRVLGIAGIVAVLHTLIFPSSMHAAPPLSNDKAIDIIEKALNDRFVFAFAPIGIVQLNAMTNILSVNKKAASPETYKALMGFKNINLVNISDAGNGDMFGRAYNVSLTEKGNKVFEKIQEGPFSGYYKLKLGNKKVVKIVKNIDYSGFRKSDEDKLILYVGKSTYNIIGREYANAVKDKDARDVPNDEYKYRALLRHDPFNNTWKFVGYDWGYLDTEGWKTNNYPQ